MKLQTQLTLAFTTLLVITMSIVAITIHSLLLNVLIQNEEEQLQEKGEILTQFLFDEYAPGQLSEWLTDEDLHMFVYDRSMSQLMLYSTALDVEVIEDWVNMYDLTQDDQPLWTDNDTHYVVSILPMAPGVLNRELVLITPLDDIQQVQQTFFNRLMIVFLIGLLVIIALTHYLTSRLVTPLTQLKHQLKKIERRQFDQIKRVKATGEIKEVEKSVVDMATELERYMKSQQQFFQNASHELKTPLMTIQGYAEGIRDGVFESEDQERGLEVMVAEISRLKTIINEMILLAKLDSDDSIYEEESLYVSELVQSTVDRAIPFATDYQIALNHNVVEDSLIRVDQEKMLRAMMNIVTNAIRHAEKQVFVEVMPKNGRIQITIDDDGDGIDESLMPQLFERFIKGKGGETGLGLAISRAIVEKSNGHIFVEDSPMGGARFIIIL
ncbi:Signal transduction histidine kinase [Pelagirhabdus alkalitolerans]|uniref:histidine kinase n=1 Tax=Pelagirhabdus alkalitolerans TaxID=1612202 RepID=A0A1G6JHW0_9BACI|nr:HAMP domain-containing sensor histidine kinase [Pelagirhabdus alkalitolerans]SDC18035.1 Signal transduction histidine kinase [Pelagirhabdus alkalitolerans]